MLVLIIVVIGPLYVLSRGGSFTGLIPIMLNLLFIDILFLDIIAMILINYRIIDELKQSNNKNIKKLFRNKQFLALIVGVLWIIASSSWRISYVSQTPHLIGRFKDYFSFPTVITSSPDIMFVFLISHIFFLLFLILNDIITIKRPIFKIRDKEIPFNIGSLFGITNCTGGMIIVALGILNLVREEPYQTLFQDMSIASFLLIAFILKLLIAPMLGVITAIKYRSLLNQVNISKQVPILTSKTEETRKHSSGRSLRISSSIILGALFLIIIPASLFNFDTSKMVSIFMEVEVDVTRTAATEEADSVLQHLETLDFGWLITCTDYHFLQSKYQYFMTNTTLNYYLNNIENRISIASSALRPYHYFFKWNVSLIESPFDFLNSSIFFQYWSTKDYLSCFSWWENGSENPIIEPTPSKVNQAAFQNLSLPIKWIFSGSFVYDEVESFDAHFIRVKQLVFLNEDQDLICLAINIEHHR